jgi:predicted transposase YbfD/YdcC
MSYPAQAKFVVCDYTIENRLHYRRDVALGEDASQVRMSGAPATLAALNGGILA